jgi:hypothetical protein
MSLEINLNTLLRTICARTFPGFARTNTELPYCTYQRIGGQAIDFIDNTIPSKRNAEIQINVWTGTQIEADELILQMEDALRGATAFQASPAAESSTDFDADMERYCARQDFTIWADR